MTGRRERILVIRLGALGDLVLCFQAFHEIRQAHPNAEIALLTMPAFAEFARSMPWFDKVLIDERAPTKQVGAWARLAQQVLLFNPTRVYDLQGKLRQNVLFWLLGGPFGPQWSGAAPFCSNPRPWPPQPGMHFVDFIAAQLRSADVAKQSLVDLAWLDAATDSFSLPPRYVTLIPGCAPGHDYKRWPPEHFIALAQLFEEKNIASVAVGTKVDAEPIAAITKRVPSLRDLTGQTSLKQLAGVVRRSLCVIGNDTGPVHLAAAVGAPTWAMMSGQVDPVWSAPRGPNAHWMQGNPINTISTSKVFLALAGTLDRNA